MVRFRFPWRRPVLIVLLAIAAVGSVAYGIRAYRSLLLLQSAYELGAPKISTIRPWMTLDYVASTYRSAPAALIDALALPAGTDTASSLRALARGAGQSPFSYIQQVQRAVVAAAPAAPSTDDDPASPWMSSVGEELLAAVIVYGYPALGLMLVLGAIGLPLPTGLSTVVAGSLAAAGQMSWVGVGSVALIASVSGDAAGYALGRVASREFLEHRARWLGYTAARQARIQTFFDHWGALGVVLSRTLVSHMSAVVNVLAGAARYQVVRFLLLVTLGRVLWTGAYLGLGYATGSDLEAASGFLANFSLLVVCLTIVMGTGLAISRR